MNDPVSNAITIRLERFRQKSRIQAGSLITTVFGDAILPRGGRVSLGSLIQLLQPLGASERLVRTAVYRLVRDDWLTSEALGRKTDYLLTASGRRRFEEASKHIYAADTPGWDRRWRQILVVGEMPAPLRECVRRALYWHGFGEYPSGCFMHPTADLDVVMESLLSDGLQHAMVHLMPMVAVNARTSVCASDSDMIGKAWNLEQLASAYKGFLDKYRPIRDALTLYGQDSMSDCDAFLIRTLLIHDVRRLLLRDPQLPLSLQPPDWPGNQARQMCRELYRSLLPASERHLDTCVRLASGAVPPASLQLGLRFDYGSSLIAVAAGNP